MTWVDVNVKNFFIIQSETICQSQRVKHVKQTKNCNSLDLLLLYGCKGHRLQHVPVLLKGDLPQRRIGPGTSSTPKLLLWSEISAWGLHGTSKESSHKSKQYLRMVILKELHL